MKTILSLVCVVISFCATAQDTTVHRMEYFIDDDPGYGRGTALNINPAEEATFTFNVNLSGYTVGYHKFYLRTRDNLGRWSITARRNIEVLPPVSENDMISGEYFIDADPGVGMGQKIIISNTGVQILQDFSASLSALPVGYHKLYGRLMDANGNWSQTFRRNIEVIREEDQLIVRGEYFFKADDGFGAGTPLQFAAPSSDGNFVFTIPAGQIPDDADTIFVRVRQDKGNIWSLTRWSVVSTTLPLTWLDFTVLKKDDIVTLNWHTTNEINTTNFNVQRSTDGVHFMNIGVVQSNNRPGTNAYFFKDRISEISTTQLFYRLQQMDINGDAHFSKIVSVALDGMKGLISFYPNPSKEFITLVTKNPAELNGSMLRLTDLSGKVLLKQKLLASEQQQIQLSALAKGMYLIEIDKPSGKEIFKLIKE